MTAQKKKNKTPQLHKNVQRLFGACETSRLLPQQTSGKSKAQALIGRLEALPIGRQDAVSGYISSHGMSTITTTWLAGRRQESVVN